jgi:hypothetical protein
MKIVKKVIVAVVLIGSVGSAGTVTASPIQSGPINLLDTANASGVSGYVSVLYGDTVRVSGKSSEAELFSGGLLGAGAYQEVDSDNNANATSIQFDELLRTAAFDSTGFMEEFKADGRGDLFLNSGPAGLSKGHFNTLYFAGSLTNPAQSDGNKGEAWSKNLNFFSVPEPATMLLLGATVLCLAIYSKRRKNA